MRGKDGYDFGMGAGASVRKGKGKKKTSGSKGNFKPGGSYTSGRAIPPSPGTKPRGKFRDSDTKTGGTTSAKDRNMAKAQQRGRVTSAKPSKGPSRNTNKKYR